MMAVVYNLLKINNEFRLITDQVLNIINIPCRLSLLPEAQK